MLHAAWYHPTLTQECNRDRDPMTLHAVIMLQLCRASCACHVMMMMMTRLNNLVSRLLVVIPPCL
jgi:hypothetical protein